jgi:hypothetical protein
MNQTRLGSLIEAVFNTLIGFVISYLAWPYAAKLVGLPFNHAQHFGVVVFFTAISVARGYVVRRWFNAWLHRAAMRLAARINRDDTPENDGAL